MIIVNYLGTKHISAVFNSFKEYGFALKDQNLFLQLVILGFSWNILHHCEIGMARIFLKGYRIKKSCLRLIIDRSVTDDIPALQIRRNITSLGVLYRYFFIVVSRGSFTIWFCLYWFTYVSPED